jgi:hypothetical protein
MKLVIFKDALVCRSHKSRNELDITKEMIEAFAGNTRSCEVNVDFDHEQVIGEALEFRIVRGLFRYYLYCDLYIYDEKVCYLRHRAPCVGGKLITDKPEQMEVLEIGMSSNPEDKKIGKFIIEQRR